MNKVGKRIIRYLLLGLAGICAPFSVTGCQYFPESTFKLADDSRLPKWFERSPGLVRGNISVSMSYYIKPWGRIAIFVLQDATKSISNKATGKLACKEPFLLKLPPPGFPSGYPAYEAITVDGVTEMIEHRKMEPIFYVTDEPAVWKQYAATGCK